MADPVLLDRCHSPIYLFIRSFSDCYSPFPQLCLALSAFVWLSDFPSVFFPFPAVLSLCPSYTLKRECLYGSSVFAALPHESRMAWSVSGVFLFLAALSSSLFLSPSSCFLALEELDSRERALSTSHFPVGMAPVDSEGSAFLPAYPPQAHLRGHVSVVAVCISSSLRCQSKRRGILSLSLSARWTRAFPNVGGASLLRFFRGNSSHPHASPSRAVFLLSPLSLSFSAPFSDNNRCPGAPDGLEFRTCPSALRHDD